jgi:hypothetical protein
LALSADPFLIYLTGKLKITSSMSKKFSYKKLSEFSSFTAKKKQIKFAIPVSD